MTNLSSRNAATSRIPAATIIHTRHSSLGLPVLRLEVIILMSTCPLSRHAPSSVTSHADEVSRKTSVKIVEYRANASHLLIFRFLSIKRCGHTMPGSECWYPINSWFKKSSNRSSRLWASLLLLALSRACSWSGPKSLLSKPAARPHSIPVGCHIASVEEDPA